MGLTTTPAQLQTAQGLFIANLPATPPYISYASGGDAPHSCSGVTAENTSSALAQGLATPCRATLAAPRKSLRHQAQTMPARTHATPLHALVYGKCGTGHSLPSPLCSSPHRACWACSDRSGHAADEKKADYLAIRPGRSGMGAYGPRR